MIKWVTVRLVFIFQCIIGLQSQSIYFTNDFFQVDITSGEPVFVEITRYFKSDGGQCDIVTRLNKILYGKIEAARLWYEKLLNGFKIMVLW